MQDAQLNTNNVGKLTGDLTNFDVSGFSTRDASSYLSNIGDLPSGVKDSLQKLTSQFDQSANTLDLEFPILDNPGMAVFDLLIGRDAKLFTLSANLNIAASEDTGVDMFGMGVAVKGAIQLNGQLTFGYDTYGLREMLMQANAPGGVIDVVSDITDGFYIDDNSNLSFAGSIGITAGLSSGILSADVGGALQTPAGDPVTLSIDSSKDTDGDGRLRFRAKSGERLTDPVGCHANLPENSTPY